MKIPNDEMVEDETIIESILTKADARVESFFMMSSPYPSLFICISYIILVLYLLPKLMEGRPALEIKRLLIAYNFGMVLLSGYIFTEFGLSGWFGDYSFKCQPVDYSDSPQALRMVNVCYCFYISKFIELFDTVFFILRKKDSQVTFLHVFHHAIMPFSWWFGVKFVPGGFGTFHAWLNSLIHFVMYIYYGMAALGPAYHRFLWWKRYMTSMQIGQFLLVCLHSAQLLFLDCDYPIFFMYWIGSYAVIFLFLFINFYLQAYNKSSISVVSKYQAFKQD